ASATRSSSADTGDPDRVRARQWPTCATAARKSRFCALQRACATTRFSRPSSGLRDHGMTARNLRRPHPSPRLGLDETDVESLVEGASNPLKHRQRMATVVGVLEAGDDRLSRPDELRKLSLRQLRPCRARWLPTGECEAGR